MNSNTNKIIKYIDGELSGEALAQFEALLEKDKALKEEVYFQQQIMKSLKAKSEFEMEKNELISFLNGLEQKVDLSNVENEKEAILRNETTSKTNDSTQSSSQQSIFRKILPWATLAAAASILLFVWSPWSSNLSNDQLADTYYKNYILETTMNDASSVEENLKNGKLAYQDENYQIAENNFEVYLKIKRDDYLVQLAKGNCEFKLGRLDEAIQTFKKVVDSKTVYSDEAYWYLALSYLKKDQAEKTKSALLQISKQSEYKQQAKNLLKQL